MSHSQAYGSDALTHLLNGETERASATLDELHKCGEIELWDLASAAGDLADMAKRKYWRGQLPSTKTTEEGA